MRSGFSFFAIWKPVIPSPAENTTNCSFSRLYLRNSVIHVGTYAVQFYTINKDKKLLPYEIISTDYKNDVNNIYNELNTLIKC